MSRSTTVGVGVDVVAGAPHDVTWRSATSPPRAAALVIPHMSGKSAAEDPPDHPLARRRSAIPGHD
jgi:hypothetical protein